MHRFSTSIFRASAHNHSLSRPHFLHPHPHPHHPTPIRKPSATIATAVLIFPLLFLAAFISSFFIDTSLFSINTSQINQTVLISQQLQLHKHEVLEFPLNCLKNISNQTNHNQTCPKYYPTTFQLDKPGPICPDYFRWIHEDLRPWKSTGITRDMVERAKTTAHFRLVILKGKVYIEKYKKSIQTRDEFTIWGILQLLRRYPGKLPDLELMFDCNDRPVIKTRDYRQGQNKTTMVGSGPPPLFRYCGDRWTMDIVFPDWSFWGWAEINIKPWQNLLEDMREGNNKSKWIEREAYAYWKGNPHVSDTRRDLLKCNLSQTHDWNARLYIQDWILESQQGFKQSDLANQCTHRYKIYVEGYAWSVSEKYILACNSVALIVNPTYYDFFTRCLQPVKHYWPIRHDDKCNSIKFAVDWGNSHKRKAQEMGRAASEFMQEELKMDYVYDYMFHLLNEYAKLLRFEPRVPEGSEEYTCSEKMACGRDGLEKKFMVESLVKSPSEKSPCSLPPPFHSKELANFYRRNVNLIRQVEKWEMNASKSLNKV